MTGAVLYLLTLGHNLIKSFVSLLILLKSPCCLQLGEISSNSSLFKQACMRETRPTLKQLAWLKDCLTEAYELYLFSMYNL